MCRGIVRRFGTDVYDSEVIIFDVMNRMYRMKREAHAIHNIMNYHLRDIHTSEFSHMQAIIPYATFVVSLSLRSTYPEEHYASHSE